MSIVRHLARVTAGLAVAAATLGTAGTAFADTSGLTLSGDAAGEVTQASVSCIPLVEGYYSWELTGQLDGAPITITFNTANYHGAGAYQTTGIPEAKGGLVTVETGAVQVVTDADDTGTFTIDEHEHTGSIDTDLTTNGQHVHVTGSWTCS